MGGRWEGSIQCQISTDNSSFIFYRNLDHVWRPYCRVFWTWQGEFILWFSILRSSKNINISHLLFLLKELQGKQPRVKDFHFYPEPAKSFISQTEAQKFFDELNSIFHVSFIPVIRSHFYIFLVNCWFPEHLGDRMSSISHDLILFHLRDYRNINLRCSLQPNWISGQSPAISPSSDVPSLPGHPPLPGSPEENKNNRDSQARLSSQTERDNFYPTVFGTGWMDCLLGFTLPLARPRANLLNTFGLECPAEFSEWAEAA